MRTLQSIEGPPLLEESLRMIDSLFGTRCVGDGEKMAGSLLSLSLTRPSRYRGLALRAPNGISLAESAWPMP